MLAACVATCSRRAAFSSFLIEPDSSRARLETRKLSSLKSSPPQRPPDRLRWHLCVIDLLRARKFSLSDYE